MAENGKIQVFGKSYNAVGDNQANLCLCTNGDVKIKTPNRYVTIFKNGKLNVDDFTEIFWVDSVDKLKKNGVYLVSSTDEDGNEFESVYLEVDGNRILLTSSADYYLSYSATQDLTPDQITLALDNIGLYFDTLDDAKNSGIQNGMVYILNENELYKVVNGEFIKMFEPSDTTVEAGDHEHVYDQLQVGNIFIDGINNLINTEGSLILQIDGTDYMAFQYNNIYMKRNTILSRGITVKTEGAVEGESGLLIYEKDGEIYLETDYLIVHNPDGTFEPSLYTAYIGCYEKNLITAASVADPEDTDVTSDDGDVLQLTLKYKNGFAVGDKVLIQLEGGNKATGDINAEENEEGQECYVLSITLDHAPTVITTLLVTYELSRSVYNSSTGDWEEQTAQTTTQIAIDPNEDEDDYDDDEPDYKNNYGSVKICNLTFGGVQYEEISDIISVSVVSGDSDIYYVDEAGDSTGGATIPVPYIATVEQVEPFVITVSLPSTEDGVLAKLVYSPIYRVGSPSSTEYLLYQSYNSLSLRENTVENNELKQTTTSQIGDLSVIAKPSGLEYFSGYGIYSDLLIAIWPLFYGATFEGTEGNEYPTYGENLEMPEEDFADEKYDKDIPDIKWVKALIEDEKEPLYYYFEEGTNQHTVDDKSYAYVRYEGVQGTWQLIATNSWQSGANNDSMFSTSAYFKKAIGLMQIYARDNNKDSIPRTVIDLTPDMFSIVIDTYGLDGDDPDYYYKHFVMNSENIYYNSKRILTTDDLRDSDVTKVSAQSNDTTGILSLNASPEIGDVMVTGNISTSALKTWLDDNGYGDSGETKVTKVSAQSNDITGILSLEASPETGEVMVTGNLSTSALKTWLDDNGYGGEGGAVDSVTANNTDSTGILILSISPTTGDVVVTGGIDQDKLDTWLLAQGYIKSGTVNAGVTVSSSSYNIESTVRLVTGTITTSSVTIGINGTMTAGQEIHAILKANTDVTLYIAGGITPADNLSTVSVDSGNYVEINFISDGSTIYSRLGA